MDFPVALIIRSWASREGLPMSQRDKLVALLDSDHLHSLPLPKKTREWPMNPSPNTYRHHFYCQFARLLEWRERQPIAKEIHDYINDHWPDTLDNHKRDGEEEVQHDRKRGLISISMLSIDCTFLYFNFDFYVPFS